MTTYMLCVFPSDPEARPSVDAILNHAFFTGPGVYIPTHMPVSSLHMPPTFTHGDLEAGSVLVTRLLSRPIGDLRSAKQFVSGTTAACATIVLLAFTVAFVFVPAENATITAEPVGGCGIGWDNPYFTRRNFLGYPKFGHDETPLFCCMDRHLACNRWGFRHRSDFPRRN